MQLALLEIDEPATGIARVAVRLRDQFSARRQRRLIDFEHMGQGTDAVERVLPFAVGNRIGAVFEIDPHAGDTELFGILSPIPVTVHVDFSDDDALLTEHTTLHRHFCRCNVRAETAAEGLHAIGSVPLQRTRTDTDTIGHRRRDGIGQGPDRKIQLRPPPPARIRRWRSVQSHGSRFIGKPGGKVVDGRNGGKRRTRIVRHPYTVVEKVRDFDDLARSGLLNK